MTNDSSNRKVLKEILDAEMALEVYKMQLKSEFKTHYEKVNALRQKCSPFNKRKYKALYTLQRKKALPDGYENKSEWGRATRKQWGPIAEFLGVELPLTPEE